jgi:hypothetical protein
VHDEHDDYDLDLEEPVLDDGPPPRTLEEFRRDAGEIDPEVTPVIVSGPSITVEPPPEPKPGDPPFYAVIEVLEP